MGRVITSVVGQTRPGLLRLIRVVGPIAIILGLISALFLNNVYIFAAVLIAVVATAIIAAIVIGLLYRVTITITEDELIVKSREGVITIPRSIVTSSNILCIKERSEISWRSGIYIRTAQVYKLRMSYGPVNYTIQLYEWGYDRLVNSLREYWGWIPPECPSTR
jgi:hypothetical protein